MTDEDHKFWIYLVEEIIALDWREAYVPVACLPHSLAVALADRLHLTLEIEVTEYIFHQGESTCSKLPASDVLH